jgi:phage shock protein A
MSILSKRVHYQSQVTLYSTTKWIIKILLNLRSDLATRLAEQQSTLTEAKSELEANVKGTTELESVSELQVARLDRQIEQFEELQRVLVKI